MGRRSYYDTDEERLPEGMTRIGYDADDQTYTFRDSDGSIWESAPGSRYGNLTKISNGPSSSTARQQSTPSRTSRSGHDGSSTNVADPTGHGRLAHQDEQQGRGGCNDGKDDDDDDERSRFLPAPPPYTPTRAAAAPRFFAPHALPPIDGGGQAREGGSGGGQQEEKSWRHELMPLLHFFLLIGLFLLGIFWLLSHAATHGGGETALRCAGRGGGLGDAPYLVKAGDTCWAIAESRGVEVAGLRGARGEALNCDRLAVGQPVCFPSQGE